MTSSWKNSIQWLLMTWPMVIIIENTSSPSCIVILFQLVWQYYYLVGLETDPGARVPEKTSDHYNKHNWLFLEFLVMPFAFIYCGLCHCRYRPTLVQAMTYCPTTPSRHPNQYWFIINEVSCRFTRRRFYREKKDITHWNMFESCTSKSHSQFPKPNELIN